PSRSALPCMALLLVYCPCNWNSPDERQTDENSVASQATLQVYARRREPRPWLVRAWTFSQAVSRANNGLQPIARILRLSLRSEQADDCCRGAHGFSHVVSFPVWLVVQAALLMCVGLGAGSADVLCPCSSRQTNGAMTAIRTRAANRSSSAD